MEKITGVNQQYKLFKTSLNKDKILYNSHFYTIDKKTPNRQYWRCVTRPCKGRLVSIFNGDDIEKIVESGEHNHVLSESDIQQVELSCHIKDVATTSDYSTSQVYTIATRRFSISELTETNKKKIYKNIQNIRKRNQISCFDNSNLNTSLNTFRGDKFCIFDSTDRSEDKRLIIFGTRENLLDLEHSDILIGDGTFKVAPNNFCQVYIFHGRIFNKILPLVYILCGNKIQGMYERAFQILKDQPNFSFPENIILDFELAAYNAFKTIASGSRIYFCLFHFGQCIWRKVQKMGLSKMFISDMEFRLHIKSYLSLAFVPNEHVHDEYFNLKDKGKMKFPEINLNEFWKYFSETFMTELYPVASWSAYFRLFNDIPLTTNTAESFNRVLTSRFDQIHSGLNTFVEKLKDQQSLVEQDIETLMLNPTSYQQSTKTAEKYQKLKVICTGYHQYRGTRFLRAIAKTYNWKIK